MTYFKVPTVAKMLGVRRDTVSGWIARGELAAIDLAESGQRHQYRVTQEQVDAFTAGRVVCPPTLLTAGEIEYYR